MRITAVEAAKMLDVNEKTIRRMLKDGRLHAEKKDGRFLIESAEIEALRVSTVTNTVQPSGHIDELEGRLSILEDTLATPGTDTLQALSYRIDNYQAFIKEQHTHLEDASRKYGKLLQFIEEKVTVLENRIGTSPDTLQPAIDKVATRVLRLDTRIDVLGKSYDKFESETGRRFFEMQKQYDTVISSLEDKITALETELHAVSSSAPVQVVQAIAPPVSGQSTGIVEDGIPLLIFAKSHGVSRETLKSQVERGDVPCSQVPIASRPGQTSKFFTLAQQRDVLQYWTAKGTAFTPCPQCPHEPNA